MKEMKKTVRSALESRGRFAEAATKAEPGQRESYQRISDGFHSVAKDMILEMNVEALDEPKNRFRVLDPKKT